MNRAWPLTTFLWNIARGSGSTSFCLCWFHAESWSRNEQIHYLFQGPGVIQITRNDSIQNRSVCDPNHCSTPYDQQKTSAIIRISHHHQVSASIDTWNVTFHSWKRYSNIENGNFYSQPNSVLELSLIYDGGPDKGVKEQINDFDISKDFHIELKQLTYGVIRSPVYNLLMAEFLHWTSLFNHPPQDISAILGVTTNIPRKWRDPL